jgi:hypothetical protein
VTESALGNTEVAGAPSRGGSAPQTTIAILLPVTSRNRTLRRVVDADIFRLFLPSLIETASWDHDLRYALHVGIDEDDPFYSSPSNRSTLIEELRHALQGRSACVFSHSFRGTAHAPCWVWNALFALSYADGADYFYQMGDDVRLQTAGWARFFIQALQSNPVFPGLGVAGPLETVAKSILTQAFVSRIHMEIFGTFYPPAFRNWWSDDWITKVYAPDHLFICDQHMVDNVGGVERYAIDAGAHRLLAGECAKGRQRLGVWLDARGVRSGRSS